MTKAKRKLLIKKLHHKRRGWMLIPQEIAPVDELPEADLAEIVKTYKATTEADGEDTSGNVN